MDFDSPRIVSLLPAATEMICAIGLGDCLMGVSHACNWPREVEALPRLTSSRIDPTADSAAIDAAVASRTRAGESLYDVSAELLRSLAPTLIVTQAQCDVCAVSERDVTAIVRDCRELSATRVLALNPRSLDDVFNEMERIGAAADRPAESRAAVDGLRRRVAAVKKQVASTKRRRRRVVVIEWISPLMAAGNWTPELVRLAGGRYDLAIAGEPSPCVLWSKIVEYAPELLVVAPCGFDLVRSRAEARSLTSLPYWSQIPAVASGACYVVDGDALFNRPGPRLVDTLEHLERWLAPQRHGDAAVDQLLAEY